MVKLSVDQLKALQSMKQMQMQQANPQFHFSKHSGPIKEQISNLTRMQFSQMNSSQKVTEHQQSEILRLIMENTTDIKEKNNSDVKENVRHSNSGMKPGQFLKYESYSKMQTNENSDINRKRFVYDKQQVPYKMDYTDPKGQSAKTAVLSMTSASSRQESS